MARVKIEVPDDIKVQLSQMNKNQILKAISEATSLELAKNVKVSWDEMRKEALLFLSSITSLDKEYANFTAAQLKNIVANPEIASYVNQMQGKKEKQYVQSLYMLAARFEDYLSRFREEDKERSILYVFTSEDGKTVETYELTLRELILNSDKAGRWQDIAKTKLQDNQRINIEKRQGFFNGDHVQEAQQAYEGSLNRWLRFFEVHPKNQRQNGLIMQKESNEQAIGNLINTGDLKEAYVAYLFSDHENNLLCGKNKGTEPYYDHDFIGTFYKNYITKVTNLEAILEEDVLTTDKQYGVKGRKASLPSLKQYITTANLIIQQQKILTKEELETELNKKFNRGDESKGARNMQMTVEEAFEKGYILKDEFKNLMKGLTK